MGSFAVAAAVCVAASPVRGDDAFSLSTAGDAALSFSDPGHLTNGPFSLPEPLQVSLSKSSWTR